MLAGDPRASGRDLRRDRVLEVLAPGAELQPRFLQGEPAAFVGDGLAAQQPQDHAEPLVEPLALRGRLDPEHARVGLQRAGARAEHHPAAGHVVELHDPLGDHERMVVGNRDHAGAEPDVLRVLRGDRDEDLGRGDDLVARRVVLADPGLVEAQLVEPSSRARDPGRCTRSGPRARGGTGPGRSRSEAADGSRYDLLVRPSCHSDPAASGSDRAGIQNRRVCVAGSEGRAFRPANPPRERLRGTWREPHANHPVDRSAPIRPRGESRADTFGRRARCKSPRGAAHLAGSGRRHHRRVRVRQLRRGQPRALAGRPEGDPDHERDPGRGAELRPELLLVRRRRALRLPRRQRPRRRSTTSPTRSASRPTRPVPATSSRTRT